MFVSARPADRIHTDYIRYNEEVLVSTHKMHADEADITIALVKRLVALQFPQWAALSIESIDSAGTDNAIYRLGDDMAGRLPRIEDAASHIDKEYRWLPQLASHLPLAIPIPLGKGRPAESYPWPWSIYQWLDGESATVGRISNLHQAAIDLGQFIAALHKVNSTDGPLSSRGLPLSSRNDETRAAINALQGVFNIDALAAAWGAALAEPPWQGPPVWIHGDLHESNLLVQQGKLTAVIDFGSSGIGDPACDMMVAWTLLSAETRHLFRETVQVDDATWARGRGWALTFGIVALPYYEKTNPVLAGTARKAIDEVLADHK